MSNIILISLDCLLDTRIGTVSKINKDIANKLINSETYHIRDQDLFDGIDKELFRKLYKERDEETLTLSLMTNMIPLLKHLVFNIKKQSIVMPFNSNGEIVINTYPYKLSIGVIETICKAMSVWMQGIAPITYVNYSPKELTPAFCKNNYALMIMYDYDEWLEVNSELFLRTQIPDITLFAPSLYFVNKPTKEELNKLNLKNINPLQAIETLAKGIVSLELIDISFFSIINEKYKNIKL